MRSEGSSVICPFTTLSRLERDDVEFIRTQIPATLLPAAHKLELRVFMQEVLGFPVADPPLKRLVYAFPLAAQTSPPLFRGKGTLRVEPAGMVEWEGRPRTIQLRLINQGRERLSDIILERPHGAGQTVGRLLSSRSNSLHGHPLGRR